MKQQDKLVFQRVILWKSAKRLMYSPSQQVMLTAVMTLKAYIQ